MVKDEMKSRRQTPRLAAAVAILIAAWAVEARAADLPAINSPATTEWYNGKLVWADLFTSDQLAAQTFYTGLFHWTSATIERETPSGRHSYVILSNEGRPLAGIAVRPRALKDEVRGRWVGYVSVKDVPLALATVTTLGGRVVFPDKSLPQRGTQAIFSDPEGALLGVIHSSSGDPGEFRPEAGDWTWAEHFARDVGAALRFYHGVFAYDITRDDRVNQPNAFILSSRGYARASLAPLPAKPHARPGWLLFLRVADASASVAKAVSLGGEVLVAPKQVDPSTRLAILRDPVGAAIGLVEMAEPTGSADGNAPASRQP